MELRDCILWEGAVSEGYGKVGRLRAHRIAWELEHGQIPEGNVIHHECGEKLCVNFAHLRSVTRAEHMREHDNIHRARSVAVENATTRTHCKRGHAYAEHGYVIPLGQRDAGTRQCRSCHALNRLERRRERSGVRFARPWLPLTTEAATADRADDAIVTGVDAGQPTLTETGGET
jgi:hypothetical protein